MTTGFAGSRTTARSQPSNPTLLADIRDSCEGRTWWARLPLLMYFAYAFLNHVTNSAEYRSFFDALNLGIHELGHYVFNFGGQFLTAAGGTIAQCAAPILGAVVFFRQRDYFGVAVASMWFATNCFEVAIYVADARALQLTLVSPGVGALPAGDSGTMHDWNTMLGPMGMLQYDTGIAWLFRLVGGGAMLFGLGFGGWLLWVMARPRDGSGPLRRDRGDSRRWAPSGRKAPNAQSSWLNDDDPPRQVVARQGRKRTHDAIHASLRIKPIGNPDQDHTPGEPG